MHSKEHAAILLLASSWNLLLIAGLCLRWPERIYESRKVEGFIWTLMGLWFIPRTDENSIHFVRGCFILGSVLSTVAILVAILYFHLRIGQS